VALIETALVTVLLMTLIIGTFELGMAWRSSITNANAARAGARVASSQGVNKLTDQATVLAVSSGLRSTGNLSIKKIVIFRSSTANGVVPSTCLTSSTMAAGGNSSSDCNVYSGARVDQIVANATGTQANFAGTCSGSSQWDRFWCPKDRNNVQLSSGGLDYVGVYVEVEQPTFTRMFGTAFTIKDTSVMRIEPAAGNA
jgi:Flp pilus assembly protein TadG